MRFNDFFLTIKIVGEVQITNAFDASLLDLNPTMAEALDFKEK